MDGTMHSQMHGIESIVQKLSKLKKKLRNACEKNDQRFNV